MKKKAFTLPEVLIALAIVGVIAALTIPQVITATEKQKKGSTIGRAIEQIELGCQNLIQYYNEKVTDGIYITTLSEIPDLTTDKLATFIGANPSKGTFSEEDVKNYVAYNNYDLLWYIMPPAYAEVDPRDIGTIDDVRNNINNFTRPSNGYTCPSGKVMSNITMPSNNPMTSSIDATVCLEPELAQKIKDLFQHSNCQINYNEEEVRQGNDTSCEKESEIMVWHMSNGTYKCIQPCTGNETLVMNPYTGYEECKAPTYTNPNCTKPPAPDCNGILEYDEANCTYTCTPNQSSKLFRLNKLATEIYFVNDINTTVSKPDDVVSRILIDYNGTNNKPNTQGKDIYAFELLNNGKLKAYDDFAKTLVKNGFKVK